MLFYHIRLQIKFVFVIRLSPTAIVMDVSAVLWTVDSPSHANVETFILGFNVEDTPPNRRENLHIAVADPGFGGGGGRELS